MLRIILIAISLLSLPAECFSHSGGTDSRGGHVNRKTGSYHYHGGSAAVGQPSKTSTASYSSYRARTSYNSTARSSVRQQVAVREDRISRRKAKLKEYRGRIAPVDLGQIESQFTYLIRPTEQSSDVESVCVDLQHPKGGIRPKEADLQSIAKSNSTIARKEFVFFLERGHYSITPWATIRTNSEFNIEHHQVDLDYEVCSWEKTGGLLRIEIMLYPHSLQTPSKDELQQIALSMVPESYYVVRFFLPGMSLQNPEWANVSGKVDTKPRTAVYNSRRPTGYF